MVNNEIEKQKSTSSIRWRYFPLGYELKSETWRIPSAPFLPLLIDTALTSLLPSEVFSGELRDSKGGEWGNRLELGSALKEEELLHIAGDVYLAPKIPTPFTLTLITQFLRFEKGGHIVYRVLPQLSGAFTDHIQPLHLLRSFYLLPNIHPKEFRIALNLLKNKRWFILGNTPSVTESLHLEADEKSIRILLWGEGLTTKRYELLEKRGVLKWVENLSTEYK